MTVFYIFCFCPNFDDEPEPDEPLIPYSSSLMQNPTTKVGLVCKWRIEWDWQKTFLKFFMSLRRRKGGDTPVSPAPPCRTHFYREFSSLTLSHTTKPTLKVGFVVWRIEWDSNSRYALGVHTISNRAPSTTRPSIQTSLFIKQNKIFARANFHFS